MPSSKAGPNVSGMFGDQGTIDQKRAAGGCSGFKLEVNVTVMDVTASRTVVGQLPGKVRRQFTPIRKLFAHYSHSRRIVLTAILTLFAHYSHGLTLFAHYSHGRTLFAHFSHGRTLFLFARFTHYSRHHHTKFADYSYQFAPRSHDSRGGGEPVRTHSRSIRTVHTR